MATSSDDRDPVERLAEEFAERLRRGERPSLSEYSRRHPQHAEAIRELFPALALMEQFKPAPGEPGPGGEGRLEHLGDYRLLREIGRGGMGVVYEAEQLSLGRHVALKVLPRQALLNPTHLERFRREARAAGKLHHTNIVPVFGVGEADGAHFFAMQFIHGECLDKVLRDLRHLRQAPAEGSIAAGLRAGFFSGPTLVEPGAATVSGTSPARSGSTLAAGGPEAEYHRGVGRVGLQVAEALAYAHRQGVLHRDIKPSNLLLDLQGMVWITDFGLAKAEGSDELTHTGDFVGTLRFMAPERFEGKSLPQSDVYALGLTLYEMLTLRPAFEDSNKGKLIEKVLHTAPAPPRRIDPRIPRDLETIVLKCLAKAPDERYATAEALAEDLRRFLADRPIRARRSSLAEQAWRWCRRNPLVASLTAVVFVLLAAISVVSSLSVLELRREVQRGDRAEQEALHRLWAALVSEAEARRFSGRRGQRFEALEAIRQAATLPVPPGRSRDELRNAAIAVLGLPDLAVAREWPAGAEPDDLEGPFRRALENERRRARLPGRNWGLHGPADSPDGRFLAVASRPYHVQTKMTAPLRLWRVDGPEPRNVLDDPGVYEAATGFSADSRLFAAGHLDGSISVYDTETGKQVRRLQTGGEWPFCLAFHPKLSRLAVGAGSEVLVFDLERGRLLRRLPHPTGTRCLAWRPDGRRLAVSCHDMRLYLWDAEAGRQVTAPWVGHKVGGVRFTFNHRGDRVVSHDWSGAVRQWDAHTGREIFNAPHGPSLRYSPDDRLLGPSQAGDKMYLCRVADGRELRHLFRAAPEGNETYSDWSLHPDGRLLAFCTASGIGLLDLVAGEEVAFAKVKGFDYLQFGPDGALWSYGGGSMARWPVRKVAGRPREYRVGPPRHLADHPLGVFPGISSGPRQLIAIPHYGKGTEVIHHGADQRTVWLRPQYDARHARISPDGWWVAVSSLFDDGSGVGVKVWEATSGKLVAQLPRRRATSLHSFTPDGRWLVTLPATGNATRWQVGTWREGMPLPVRGTFAWDQDVALEGQENGTIRLVQTSSGREMARFCSPEKGGIRPTSLGLGAGYLMADGAESKITYAWDLRLIRRQLAELGLDWEGPPTLPPVSASAAGRLTAHIHLGGQAKR